MIKRFNPYLYEPDFSDTESSDESETLPRESSEQENSGFRARKINWCKCGNRMVNKKTEK